MPTLADILAGIDSVVTPGKRRLADLMRNPLASAQQTLGLLDDRAKTFTNALRTSQEGGELARMNSVMAGLPQYRQASDYVTNALTNQVMNFAPIGATVWHGSPHKFDKFDFSPKTMGTGEGGQAYGHGGYMAGAKETGEWYQKELSKNVTVDGSKLQSVPSDGPLAEAHNMVVRNIQSGMNPDAAIAATQKYWADAANEMRAFAKDNPNLAARIEQEAISRLKVSEAAKTIKPNSFYRDPGYLYKVDLPDEHIAKMLDWDKPLSQQPEAMKAFEQAFKDYAELYGNTPQTQNAFKDAIVSMRGGNMTGAGAYQSLSRILGGKQDAATTSNILAKEYGIPGIRYLDGGSRGAGQGTSNYVVFPGNENLLQILERNGQPIK